MLLKQHAKSVQDRTEEGADQHYVQTSHSQLTGANKLCQKLKVPQQR